jgi:CheY-like chemotaxis protein
VGEGTGLGLATCYGIVKQNQGALFVDSKLGEGTTFRAYFPRSVVAPTPDANGKGVAAARGSETVLLVEDDAMVRQLAMRGLEAAGFATLTANDGKEALSIVQAFPGRIDAVVTDVVMPRMGGAELAREVRKLRPRIPVLFTSGYSEERLPSAGERGEAFLQKPYVGSKLVAVLRQLIDRSVTA